MTFTPGTSAGAWTNQASVTSAQVELTPADTSSRKRRWCRGGVCGASFGPPAFWRRPLWLRRMSGDLNGDGRVDLVTTMPQADAVAVFLANTNGGFAPAVLSGRRRRGRGRLADLNNDGRLDLVLEGRSAAFVLLRNGAGGFGAPTTLSFAPAIVADVRVGQFNAGIPAMSRSTW